MSQVTLFNFQSQTIRTGEVDGQPVFCLTDLLQAMGSNTHTAEAKTVVEEYLGEGQVIDVPLQTAGGIQKVIFVFEAGTTFLVSRSRTKIGKKLNRWIHTEVLPSIRKTGSYTVPMSESEKLALMAEGFLKERTDRLSLVAQIAADEPATTLGKAIAKASNNIRIGDFAKAIGMGQNRYFDELRSDGIIQQTSTLPYQRFLDAKYFVVTQVISGNGKTYPVGLITPKGQAYLAKRHSKYISRESVRDAIECHVVALV